MEKITSSAELKNAIKQLEIEHAEKGILLKEQFLITYESLKPINVIKNYFKEIVSAENLADHLMGNVLSVVSGYFSKKIVVNGSDNKFRQLLGSVLQFGVTKVIAQHAETIESIGKSIFQHFLHKKE